MTGLDDDVSPALALSRQSVTTPPKKIKKSFKIEEDEQSTSASSGSSSEGEEVSSDDSPLAARSAAKASEEPKKVEFGQNTRNWFFSFLSCSRRSRSTVPAPILSPTTTATVAAATGTTHRRPAAHKPQQPRKLQAQADPVAGAAAAAAAAPTLPTEAGAVAAPSAATPSRAVLVLPPGFLAPPGLMPPPGLEFLDRYPSSNKPVTFKEWQPTATEAAQKVAPKSQNPQPVGVLQRQPVAASAALTPKARTGEFSQAAFRRELVQILDGLFYDSNTARAVQCVRAQDVPEAVQDSEFEDILTRAVETANGTVRRKMIAFAVGLAAGKPSAFSRSQCAKGVGTFLSEVCPEMQAEIPKLTSILCSEVIPTLRSVFTPAELDHHLPAFMKDCVRRTDVQLRHRQR